MPGTRPVVDFDHHTERFSREQETVLAEVRSRCPVAYTGNYGGFWVMTGYDAVRDVLADDDSFSVAKQPDGTGGLLIPPSPHSISLMPGELDPPEHTAWRKLLAPKFSKQAVESLRPLVEGLVEDCLDVAVAKGEFDIALDLGNVVPSATVIHWMGFPMDQRDEFRRATEMAFGISPPPEGTTAQEHFLWVYDAIDAHAAHRRTHPGDDMMSFVVNHPGKRFSDLEVRAFCMNMLAGGTQTTSALVSYALIELDRDRGLRRRLIDDPTLIPAALDEFLRLSCPAVGLARTVVKETEIGGYALKPGERVYVVLASANRDEDKFPAPDTVDIDRRMQNLSFGMGGHFCIGQWLAKLQARVTLTRLLDRIPGYSIDHAGVELFESRAVLNGYRRVPARTA
ncbi:MAG TPA: cytochrome P450 [Acidimicrobiia bacterium]|nr:cytochrome P450 [Acidimicrobiia bacterium]